MKDDMNSGGCDNNVENTLKRGLCSLLSSNSPEKDTNSSTSIMAMLLNLGRCFRCHQQGHWAKDCPFSAGINSRGGEGPLQFTNGISEKDVSVTMSSNPDQYCKVHHQGNQANDCLSSVGISERGGLVSSDVLENNANTSTSNTAALLISDKFSICDQTRHLVKDCHSTIGISAREGPVSSVTSNIIEKESETISMPSKSDKCFNCQQPGHWAKECPSSDSNSRGGQNSSSSYNIPQKICICGRGPCAILTSNTANNPGRKFYKCQCGFFEWCDGQTSPSKDHSPERFGSQQFTSPTHTNGSCRRIVKGYDLSTRCPCKAGPCPVRTAKTQKNMGRQFVCCPVRKGEGSCGYFKWCDELDSAASPLSSVRDGSPFVTSKQDDSLGRNDT